MRIHLAAWSGLLIVAAAGAWAQSGGPTDPQIAAIVVTANQVDIDAGKLAESMAQSKEVKQFAQLMITDHSAVNKSATELVNKLHVKPEDLKAANEVLDQSNFENFESDEESEMDP